MLEMYKPALQKRAQLLPTQPYEKAEWFSDAVELALLESRPLSTYACGYTSILMHLVCAVPELIGDRMLSGNYA